MKNIVIDLTSTGKYRIRCLQKNGITDITGIDTRVGRFTDVNENYGVQTCTDLHEASEFPHAHLAIISLLPKAHVGAIFECVKHKVSFFVEASVVDDGLSQVIGAVKAAGIVAAPSSPLDFSQQSLKYSESSRMTA